MWLPVFTGFRLDGFADQVAGHVDPNVRFVGATFLADNEG